MNRILALLSIFCLPISLIAQTNLVPNPSFETYTNCFGPIETAPPWFDGTRYGTPDYLNACGGKVIIPGGGGVKYQYPRTGNGMAGIFSANYVAVNVREYIRVKLTSPLQANSCYAIAFYVNLANVCSHGNNNMGLNFSVADSTTRSDTLLQLTPHILNYGNPVILDTMGWTRISGIYTASGNERFITIGNFFSDADTDSIRYLYHPDNARNVYYHIDDVSVVALNANFQPDWVYTDTAVTFGDSVYIGTRMLGLDCTWFDADGTQIATAVPGLHVSPSSSTFYTVEEFIRCGTDTMHTRRDTVFVRVDTLHVGLKPLPQLEFSVYPNPTQSTCSIQANAPIAHIQVLTLTGVLVSVPYTIQGQTAVLDLEALAAGAYCVRVNGVWSRLVIVE